MQRTGIGMEKLLQKYEKKLIEQGLCEKGSILLGGLDAELVWNREHPLCPVLEKVAGHLNINSILFAPLKEPYFSMMEYLAERAKAAINPEDCETRTFLHEIPVSKEFKVHPIVNALKKNKSLVVPGHGIVTFGIVSPEQAFINYSSVCFACYVKFMTDYCYDVKRGLVNKKQKQIFLKAINSYERFMEKTPLSNKKLEKGPFNSKGEAINAIISAGKSTIDLRMVDSFFGNISCLLDDRILISQTGSSLDDLAGCIDSCPVDGSSCAGITASSEYTAHRETYAVTDKKAILHGHPKYCVIISMLCDEEDCGNRGQCHIKCTKKRFIRDIPIVPGEVGTGPRGLCNTLPQALKKARGAIVYGHGLFTTGRVDFTDALFTLTDVEKMCFKELKNYL
jgi:ribulose-5-phosphate 4-epimerase/fuculose-1-phosphate aldolase